MSIRNQLGILGLTPVEGGSFAPLTEQEISEVEALLDARLPSEYRVFLETFGESDFDGWVSFSTDEVSVSVGLFFGRDLPEVVKDSSDWLPSKMIPIAEDGGGNFICLSLAPADFGEVYFRYHGEPLQPTKGGAEIAKRLALAYLASSFEAFILGLRLDEE